MKNILTLVKNINPNITESDISLLSGGFNSQAYKIDHGDMSYVVLTQKEDAVSNSQYGHAFVVLKLLESTGYKYSPKPIWLHPEEKAMIISYFNGIASNKFDFEKNSIDQKELSLSVIDAILDTSSIPINEYKKLCEKFNVTPLPVRTEEIWTKKIGTDWLNIVVKSCPDAKIKEWLQKRVVQSIELSKKFTPNEPTLGITDPSNPNILINSTGDFMLIDWDSSNYNTKGPEFYISYTTHLTDFMKPYQKEIIEHVAKRLNMSSDVLAQKVYNHRYFYEVFDVNWAAMMMARVSVGEIEGDVSTFKKIADERIAEYEREFES